MMLLADAIDGWPSVAFRMKHYDRPSAASRRLSQVCSSRWRARIARALSRIDSP
jgi:hypothetical protein